jgi:hypothetical protein
MKFKSKLFGLLLLSSLVQLSQGFADDVQTPETKVYLKRRNVRLIQQQIVVQTKDGTFTTPTLSKDEKGFFVQTADLVKSDIVPKKGKRWHQDKGCRSKGSKAFRDGHKSNHAHHKAFRGHKKADKHVNKPGNKAARMQKWQKWHRIRQHKKADNDVALQAPAPVQPGSITQ